VKTFVLQIAWVVATCVLTFAIQALLFKTASNSWIDVLTTHQWVGIPYLVITGLALERLARKRFFRQFWV
jgi:hypothetical protein